MELIKLLAPSPPVDESGTERILENLFAVLPLLHRKLLRMDLGMTDSGLSRLHLAVMAGLHRQGPTKATALARASIVPKPQMTHIINQLVDSGLVQRIPDSRDRRVVNASLTARGEEVLHELRRRVLDNLRRELARLTLDDIAEMSAALETLRRIGSKI